MREGRQEARKEIMKDTGQRTGSAVLRRGSEDHTQRGAPQGGQEQRGGAGRSQDLGNFSRVRGPTFQQFALAAHAARPSCLPAAPPLPRLPSPKSRLLQPTAPLPLRHCLTLLSPHLGLTAP